MKNVQPIYSLEEISLEWESVISYLEEIGLCTEEFYVLSDMGQSKGFFPRLTFAVVGRIVNKLGDNPTIIKVFDYNRFNKQAFANARQEAGFKRANIKNSINVLEQRIKEAYQDINLSFNKDNVNEYERQIQIDLQSIEILKRLSNFIRVEARISLVFGQIK